MCCHFVDKMKKKSLTPVRIVCIADTEKNKSVIIRINQGPSRKRNFFLTVHWKCDIVTKRSRQRRAVLGDTARVKEAPGSKRQQGGHHPRPEGARGGDRGREPSDAWSPGGELREQGLRGAGRRGGPPSLSSGSLISSCFLLDGTPLRASRPGSPGDATPWVTSCPRPSSQPRSPQRGTLSSNGPCRCRQ